MAFLLMTMMTIQVCVLDYLEKRETCLKHRWKLNCHDYLFGRVPKLGLPKILTQYMMFNMSSDHPEQ